MNAEDATGKPFFDRADQVAGTGNWDYAIEMYLQGIAKEPEEMDRGHHKLYEAALQRKAAGGKTAGFMDKRKRRSGADATEKLVNAEWLMSRDPTDPACWRLLLSSAQEGQWEEVARWSGGVLFELNRRAKKPRQDVYMFLTDTYTKMKMYTEAVRACQMAFEADPKNAELSDRLRDLSAQETIDKGKYDQEGDFTQSVKDIDGQMEMARRDELSQGRNFLLEQIEKARAAYEAEPDVPGKIQALVDTLTRVDDDGCENEAIDVLTKAHNDLGTYRYKLKIGDIKMRQMTRRYHKLVKAGDKKAATDQARQQLAFELEEFTERAANYPTDLAIKYELGRRQLIAKQYDDAIATLQQARRDPKRRLQAMSALGMAFFRKGWNTEAAETFEQALEGEVPEARLKDLRFNLGQVYEAMDQPAKALAQYSDVAQLDFNYKDVRQRIERLRGQAGESSGNESAETPEA